MCLPVLLDAAAKGVVLLVLGGLVVTAMRRSSAAARQVVWVATLAAILATPLVSALVPAWHVLPDWVRFEIPASDTGPAGHEPVAVTRPRETALADRGDPALPPSHDPMENIKPVPPPVG